MSTLLDRANKILTSLDQKAKDADKIHVVFDKDYSYTIYYTKEEKEQQLTYRSEKTALKFHADNSFVRAMLGPYGSGKSVCNMSDLLLKFRDMPVCKDGIKRRKSGIFRTTYTKLESTAIKTFLDWFADLGTPVIGRNQKYVKKPYPSFQCRFKYYDKERDESATCEWEVVFLAFETESDGEKLGSLELSDCFFNEARDFPYIIFSLAAGRVGRYPKMKDFSDDPDFKVDYWSGVNLDSNPCDKDHWFYDTFEKVKPPNYVIYHQPPAVLDAPETEIGYITNPEAENLRNLKDNYYINFVIGKPKIHVDIFAKGLYGTYVEGQLVFTEYNDDFHSSDKVGFTEGFPLHLSWDFGLTPCLLICQYVDGQLIALKEFVGACMGIENLINQEIKPWWALNNMDRFIIATSVADPAGNNKRDDDVFRPSLIGIVSRDFTPTVPATTNDVSVRLESFRPFLNRMSKGKPAFMLSRSGCPILRQGFNGKYLLKSVQRAGMDTKIYDKIPDKTHPFSEPQDCLQYTAVTLGRIANFTEELKKHNYDEPAVNLYGNKPIVLGAMR